jgi:hypothetical protein
LGFAAALPLGFAAALPLGLAFAFAATSPAPSPSSDSAAVRAVAPVSWQGITKNCSRNQQEHRNHQQQSNNKFDNDSKHSHNYDCDDYGKFAPKWLLGHSWFLDVSCLLYGGWLRLISVVCLRLHFIFDLAFAGSVPSAVSS